MEPRPLLSCGAGVSAYHDRDPKTPNRCIYKNRDSKISTKKEGSSCDEESQGDASTDFRDCALRFLS